MAIQELAPAEKQQFLCLRDNAYLPFRSLSHAMAENSFGITDQGLGRPAHRLFLIMSRFNHSCIPNSKLPTTSEENITSFATRDIATGEEITFCYDPDFECRTRHERHHLLRFSCECAACRTGTLFQQLSDMRRTLIRGLQYLTLGVDLDGQRQSSVLPIIFDPELKTAAEEFRIPLTSRLIYNILVICLLEEEGLLDDFMLERMLPGTLKISNGFKTESNARIAKLAMAQTTWLKRFCVASWLYGREDDTDHEIAMALRMLHGLP